MTAPPYRRRNLRLPAFDYSTPGTYFVTICVQNRACILGDVVDGETVLSSVGHLAAIHLQMAADRFNDVELDAHVIMPNHVHLLLNLGWNVGAPLEPVRAETEAPMPMPTSLDRIVHWFKSATTNEYIRRVRSEGWRRFPGTLWQRNYYEHIVRDQSDLDRIRTYIANNPAKWEMDTEYLPECRGF